MSSARRRVFRFVEWTLRLDQDDDAPPLRYAFRCLALEDDDTECAARSPLSEDPGAARAWVFGHLRAHPEHTGYAEVIERPWVMWRGGPV
ncbi:MULTISPECIES: DUF7848 domain-containing protein [Streptomyces]|uniref:DUF7848 domain-containing protein n=1 Tax=Streptomyces TaxID=1883 RepID=UPI00224971A3|nr:hypothetical protein [Streptomyces sp. JHD 1]MCX2969839.1 hypothetical protein [Streptomyces sp. JHD 1]